MKPSISNRLVLETKFTIHPRDPIWVILEINLEKLCYLIIREQI